MRPIPTESPACTSWTERPGTQWMAFPDHSRSTLKPLFYIPGTGEDAMSNEPRRFAPMGSTRTWLGVSALGALVWLHATDGRAYEPDRASGSLTVNGTTTPLQDVSAYERASSSGDGQKHVVVLLTDVPVL